MAHQCQDDAGARTVRLSVKFAENDLQVTETPFGRKLELDGCTIPVANPGAPALPRAILRVALPEGMWPRGLTVNPAKLVPLRAGSGSPVLPVQPPRPGVLSDHRTAVPKARGCEEPPASRPEPEEDDGMRVEPLPAPPATPPDVELYAAAARDRRVARITGLDHLGTIPVVTLEIRPVLLGTDGELELVLGVDLEMPYGPRPTSPADPERLRALLDEHGVTGVDVEHLSPMPEPVAVSRAQAVRYGDLARATVVNPDLIGVVADRWPLFDLPAEYLVITDNRSWDAATITPGSPLAGDVVAEFRRLAAHKRSRGLTAKVVTISDVVAGRYGDFRTGSRDLPEVLRKFVKSVHSRWGVAWLLLGGDVGVVPPRVAAAAVEGHMNVGTQDPPADNQSFWTGSFLEMHVVSPGTWWPGSGPRQLVNEATGALIPFDATGTSALGWYYTTDATYSTRTNAATRFVRVNGPASTVNARLQWLYEWNRIPTDFYYSSLGSWAIGYLDVDLWIASFQIPYVYTPEHDWDASGNGLYGQFVAGKDVDGVHWKSDVSVGRAPVESATEAAAFVDKVISYESYDKRILTEIDPGTRASGGLTPGQIAPSFARRVLIASSNWGGGVHLSRTTASPPTDDTFRPGSDVTVIRLKDVPSSFDYQLIAHVSDADRRELPWRGSASSGRGWYYARSATDHRLNSVGIPFPWGGFEFPLPSRWIVVHGTAAELDPAHFLFDHVGQDGSMADQETLRSQLAAEVDGWDAVSRLYEDETDLTPAQRAVGPVAHLTSTRMQDALNAAPHIVSLSGHGNPGGCCGAWSGMASGLTNGSPGFVGYADSCLTSAFDGSDAFGEELLKNPHGGAVGYVGSTRFSWIGLGDDVQRAFFHRLVTTRHLGLLNDSRLYAIDYAGWGPYARWMTFSLNLLGDPEMPVWRRAPRRIFPDIRWHGDVREPILVKFPRDPRPEPFVVHLGQGELERTFRASAGDSLSLDVSDARAGELVLTISAPDAAPVVRTLTAHGPLWLCGSVVSLVHRSDHGGTLISLASASGTRRLVVPASDVAHDLIVAAVVDAHVGGVPLGLRAARDGDGAAVDAFRFPA